jgi:hypothetical protein
VYELSGGPTRTRQARATLPRASGGLRIYSSPTGISRRSFDLILVEPAGGGKRVTVSLLGACSSRCARARPDAPRSLEEADSTLPGQVCDSMAAMASGAKRAGRPPRRVRRRMWEAMSTASDSRSRS